uniref:Uncharacterized protein n=1 Tax=viral metagenome TaxID=1070528 RepID=A0A6C0JUB2_9ZZZZ
MATKLTITKDKRHLLSDLHEGLEVLVINTPICTMPALPSTLKRLTIHSSALFELPLQFPPLTYLLIDAPIENYENVVFPATLEKLEIELYAGGNQKLSLANTSLKSLDVDGYLNIISLPDTVKEINIRGKTTLPQVLPRRLKSLISYPRIDISDHIIPWSLKTLDNNAAHLRAAKIALYNKNATKLGLPKVTRVPSKEEYDKVVYYDLGQHATRITDLAVTFKSLNLPPYVLSEIIDWDRNRKTDAPAVSAFDVDTIAQHITPILHKQHVETYNDDDEPTITYGKMPPHALESKKQKAYRIAHRFEEGYESAKSENNGRCKYRITKGQSAGQCCDKPTTTGTMCKAHSKRKSSKRIGDSEDASSFSESMTDYTYDTDAGSTSARRRRPIRRESNTSSDDSERPLRRQPSTESEIRARLANRPLDEVDDRDPAELSIGTLRRQLGITNSSTSSDDKERGVPSYYLQ